VSERKPYIGVTGITKPEQAQAAAEAFRQNISPDADHIGMTGYLVSLKNVENKAYQTDKYPPINTLPELLAITKDTALNTIHYRTHNKNNLADQLIRLFEKDDIYDQGLCQTVQLNMKWPDKDQLQKVKHRFPHLQVILQLGPNILHNEDRFNITDQIIDYGDLVDYVLIDPSGGEGITADSDLYAHLYRPINSMAPDKTIIIAGGLEPENVLPRLQKIGQTLQTKGFGIDAEKGLRIPQDNSHRTDLSDRRIREYIEQASAFYRSQK
jgi:phosphoribosylanthranilate isomerase